MKLLSAEKISVTIDRQPILRGISLDAYAGEFIGLIGPNGGGKSTLIRTLTGFVRPTSGRIEIAGKLVADYSHNHLARMISYVPQQTTVDYDFSVQEIVLMGRHPYLSRFGTENLQDYKITYQAMQETGITHLATRTASSLSGGQQQMMFIAKAIAQEPQLLLLDEPVSALDIRYQLQVLELVRRLADDSGLTVIAALHDLNLASRYCDRLVLLRDGKWIASGPPEEVLTPQTIHRAYDVHAHVFTDSWSGSTAITAYRD